MFGTAEEMGHRVVCGMAVGASEVVGPAYGVAVGLEPRAVAGAELEEGTSIGPEQQLFGWYHWWGDSPEHLVGHLRSNDLPNHPESYEASGQGVSDLLQDEPWMTGGGLGSSTLTRRAYVDDSCPGSPEVISRCVEDTWVNQMGWRSSVSTNFSVVKPQLDSAKAFITLRAFAAHSAQVWVAKDVDVSSLWLDPTIVGQFASPQPEGDIRDHTHCSLISMADLRVKIRALAVCFLRQKLGNFAHSSTNRKI